jgi:uncharacterized DUF497 family protein
VEIEFEWDAKKAASNLVKHGVSFDEASTIFGDSLATTIPDPDHSSDEERWVTTGQSAYGRLLIVSHTDRWATIRIVNARAVTARERRIYESGE